MPVLAVMDQTGDKRIKWDKDNPASVEKARRKFDNLKFDGYAFFRADSQISEFDPDAGEILAVPPMQGG